MDDAAQAKWFALNEMPEKLAFDHNEMLRVALEEINKEIRLETKDWKEMTRLPFENAEFSAPTAYDKILRTMYGEYMTPPAPSHRVPHFLKDKKYIVDPGRDYRLYLQELNKE